MTWALVIMALFYIGGGINHFVNPKVYEKMMPPYLPAHRLLVQLSGVAEIALGAALFSTELRPWAAWGIIALLVAVFPANLHMYRKGGKAYGVPDWALLVRLPLQGALIAWAYAYT